MCLLCAARREKSTAGQKKPQLLNPGALKAGEASHVAEVRPLAVGQAAIVAKRIGHH